MSLSISGASTINAAQYARPAESNVKLTDDQKKKLTDILGNYDSASMTKESTKKMMDEIKAAGITPSKDLRETLDAAGFKPPEKPKNAHPDDGSVSTTNQQPQYVTDFLEKAKTGQVSSTDLASLISNLQNTGQSSQGSLVDAFS